MFKFKSGVKNCKDSNKLDYKLIADTYKTAYKHTTEHSDKSEEGNHTYLIFDRAVGNHIYLIFNRAVGNHIYLIFNRAVVNFVNIYLFFYMDRCKSFYLLDYILENL